jgi:predicted phosphodiesterase
VVKRGLTPLSRFKRYIGRELSPFYADDEIAVLGINTVRALSFKSGRINRTQVKNACVNFAPLSMNVIRIVVTHHPFAVPETGTHSTVIGRAKMAMEAFGDCKVDIVLSGHLHVSRAITSDTLYAGPHAALLVQAGTASSTRLRDETNAFNLLRIEGFRIEIERHDCEGGRFVIAHRQSFRRRESGWAPEND